MRLSVLVIWMFYGLLEAEGKGRGGGTRGNLEAEGIVEITLDGFIPAKCNTGEYRGFLTAEVVSNYNVVGISQLGCNIVRTIFKFKKISITTINYNFIFIVLGARRNLPWYKRRLRC